MNYISAVSQLEPFPRMHATASEVLHRNGGDSTSILEQYNTAGAVLSWSTEKASTPVEGQFSAAKAMLLWVEHWIPSEPHEELIPWVAWFRPISARNYVWEYTWPEEEYLHP